MSPLAQILIDLMVYMLSVLGAFLALPGLVGMTLHLIASATKHINSEFFASNKTLIFSMFLCYIGGTIGVIALALRLIIEYV